MNKQRGNGAQSPWSWFVIVVGAALVLGVGSVRPVWATVVQNPCAGVADGTPCDDSDPCTVGESCQGEVCTGGSPAPDGTSCDDFDPCTVNDTCIDGLCQGGGANPQCGCCQFDSYLSSVFGETAASVFGSCSSPVTESFCSQELGGTFQSGASCNLETGLCEPAATCGNEVVEAGEECDDGNTVGGDCCDAQCHFEPVESPCDDGNACTIEDACDGEGSCVGGVPLTCDDGNVCNGVESCDPQFGCQAGTPLNCDDGNVCNGVESCDPQLGCQAGTPVSCAPAVPPCEAGEQCNPSTGLCEPLPDPPNTTPCDLDQNVCTTDRCDGAGSCVFVENAASGTSCDDGLFCNGTDTCDGSGTCEHSGDPCVGGAECNQICNEAQDNCFDPPGTPCSDDGLVCTADACNGSGSCAHTALPPAQCPKGYVLLEAPSTATATARLERDGQAVGAACAESAKLLRSAQIAGDAVAQASAGSGLSLNQQATVGGACVTGGGPISLGASAQCAGGQGSPGAFGQVLSDCIGAADLADVRRGALMALPANQTFGPVTVGSNTTVNVSGFGAVPVIDYQSLVVKPNKTLTIQGGAGTQAVVVRVAGDLRVRRGAKIVGTGMSGAPGSRILILVGNEAFLRRSSRVEGTVYALGKVRAGWDSAVEGALLSKTRIEVGRSAVVNHVPWVLW